MMQWNYRKIRKRSFDCAFKKDGSSWFRLVVVGFIFAFIGASNSSQITFIKIIDKLFGADRTILSGDAYILRKYIFSADNALISESADILRKYIVETPLVRTAPFITHLALIFIDGITNRASWLLRFLAANSAYFNRNKGEVVAALFIGSAISLIYRYCVLNVAVVGQCRFAMENHFSKNVSLRRLIAPFHRKTLMNTVRVMLIYHALMFLWSLTLIGGVYKYYQYYAIPYLVAENPAISWRDAKNLSCRMTDGKKMKIFLTQISFFYVWILKAVPVAGLLAALPLEMSLHSEIYFVLREDFAAGEPELIEPAFSGPTYADVSADEPVYVLSDLAISRPNIRERLRKYRLVDYIFMFFVYCLMGWVWECILYIFYEHAFINRGTMYGPWIPIYGIGGTLIIILLDKFKENKVRLFIMTSALCAFIEYLTSFILEYVFNSSYWDYKADFLNLNGRICLAGLLSFGIGGVSAIYVIAPAISSFTLKLSRKKQVIISVLLCAAFLADLTFCIIFGFNSGRGVGGKF